jgi:hypothetical protein
MHGIFLDFSDVLNYDPAKWQRNIKALDEELEGKNEKKKRAKQERIQPEREKDIKKEAEEEIEPEPTSTEQDPETVEESEELAEEEEEQKDEGKEEEKPVEPPAPKIEERKTVEYVMSEAQKSRMDALIQRELEPKRKKVSCQIMSFFCLYIYSFMKIHKIYYVISI